MKSLSGITLDRAWKYLLLPGMIFQWLVYMFGAGPGWSAAASGRQARSKVMTYALSFAFYVFLVAVLVAPR